MSRSQTIRNSLRARLIERGMSIDSWAREHGYLQGVVPKIISRYVGRDKRPNRGQSLEIIKALEDETGIKICG